MDIVAVFKCIFTRTHLQQYGLVYVMSLTPFFTPQTGNELTTTVATVAFKRYLIEPYPQNAGFKKPSDNE